VIALSVALKAALPTERGRPVGLVREQTRVVDPQAELANANGIAVNAGLFIENLHSLSLRQRIFNAEGFYWLEWPRSLQTLMEAEEISPL